MTEHTTILLNILQGQEDPLSSNELVDCSGLTQTEVLKALGELNQTYHIRKSIAGYKLLSESVDGTDAHTDQAEAADALKELLVFFTRHTKSFLPKAICDQLGWDAKTTRLQLKAAKNAGLVSMKNSGFYYLTPDGVRLIQQRYPDIEVKAFVMDKAKEHVKHFHIVAPHLKGEKERQAGRTVAETEKPHPAIAQARTISATLKLADHSERGLPQLTEIPVKIVVLDELAKCFGADVQIQLQQLSGFLKEYARA